MISKKILLLLIITICLDATLGVFLYSQGINKFAIVTLIPVVILSWCLGVVNIKNISLSWIDVVLLSLLLLSTLRGIYGILIEERLTNLGYILFDLIAPLVFILICNSKNIAGLICVKVLKNTASILAAASVSGALIFYFLGASVYQGITLPVNIPFCVSTAYIFTKFKWEGPKMIKYSSLLFLMLACTYVSGKRSYILSEVLLLISCTSVNIIDYWKIRQMEKNVKIKTLTIVGTVALLILVSIAIIYSSNVETKFTITFDNLVNFYESIQTNYDGQVASLLTAGRSDEINSLAPLFTQDSLSIFLGFGPGFTYNYQNEFSSIVEINYRNIHLSILNLTTKYGIVFSMLFYYKYLLMPAIQFFSALKNLRRLRCSTNTTDSMYKQANLNDQYFLVMSASFYVFISLFQSLFAFTLFVDPLLPIAIAMSRKYYFIYKP